MKNNKTGFGFVESGSGQADAEIPADASNLAEEINRSGPLHVSIENAPYNRLVQGRVTDLEQRPVKDADVLLNCSLGASTTTTDEQGSFASRLPECGWFRIDIQAQGFFDATFNIPPGINKLELVIRRDLVLTGNAVWKTGNMAPVTDFNLSIKPVNLDEWSEPDARQEGNETFGPEGRYHLVIKPVPLPGNVHVKNDHGWFEVHGLKTGVYRIQGTTMDGGHAAVTVTLDDTGKNEVRLEFVGTGSVSGVLADSDTGEPLEDSRVVLEGKSLAGGRAGYRTQSRKDGFFRIEQAEEGDYSLTVTKRGYMRLFKLDITVSKGRDLDLGTLQMDRVSNEKNKGRRAYKIEYSGIGASIISRAGRILVSRIVPDSPADREGLRVGDRILTVDGEKVQGVPAYRVAAMIRGEEGSVVELTVQRGKERGKGLYSFSIVREELESKSP
ncbi:MAG: PDZ domain-containing protein [Deltaproteobacteria bacterium]|nr:PDZ domain-containing protein [Deltaproteobacteria bacterium]